MRKYFWGFGLCGALLAGGAGALAHHAARHPHSFVGRVMHGANYAASRMSPAAGFGPVLSSLKKKDVASTEVCGVPHDPEPVEENPSAIQPVAHSSAPIVIPEEEKPIAVSVAEPMTQPGAFGPASETPASGVAQAPVKMPPCDEEECETLPMPLIEEDEEEQESDECGTGGTSGLFKLFFQMPKLPSLPMSEEESSTPAEEPKKDEAQADPYHNHHHHYSGCPYTGQMYRGCPTGCPGPKPSYEEPKSSKEKANGSEEASEEETKPNEKSALGTIRKFKRRQPVDDGCPTHPGVDTMEMRPSDRQLYEYGPGGM